MFERLAKKVYTVDINQDYGKVSEELGLGLSSAEMEKVSEYFNEKNRLPTDIELQSIDQAWSEHCCYKSSRVILEETLFSVKGDSDVVAREDAGVMEFDDENYYVVGLESHNHPSAIDPYGGAATGIGGILRDVVCMGAQPIALTDSLFFGDLDIDVEKLPEGVKHPRYLMGGVVAGIRDYGNRVGIPTVAGQVNFHEGYTGNPLVVGGCIGILPKNELIHSRVGGIGDVFILAGGRTGRDGIHGVTFASAELHADSEGEDIGAVQLGDPITKEPLMHLCLELNRKKFLTGMKDLGGGGLSCVVGEMALEGGFGASVKMEKVPLKASDLAPWEIWVSESQERMMFTVKPKDVEVVLAHCRDWDVEASVIGEVIEEKRVEISYEDKKILDLDLEFTTAGPIYRREYNQIKKEIEASEELPAPSKKLSDSMLGMLSEANTASKSWVIRQYDHEVRGNTTIKPLQGKIGHEGAGDSTVMKPIKDSWKGLAITTDVNSYLMEKHAYHGSMAAVEEICRNLVSVGARPDSIADCLCFGNPEKPDRMGEFRATCEGLAKAGTAFGIPFVSGNVSFYNETAEYAVPPTPALLGIGIVEDIRKCITSDLKAEGDLWIVGETKQEMGGSLYYRENGWDSKIVPQTDVKGFVRDMNALLDAMDAGEVVACHDCSAGGMGIAIIEMCIGGARGVKITIPTDLREDIALFSESNGRWIVQVKPGLEDDFASRFECATKIGKPSEKIRFHRKKVLSAELTVKEIREAWEMPIWNRLA